MKINDFYKRGVLFAIFLLTLLFASIILIKYFALSLTDVKNSSLAAPVAERGSIVDRTGKVLAVQSAFYHVGVSLRRVSDAEEFSAAMSGALGMEKREIKKILKDAEGASFVYLKKKVPHNVYLEAKKAAETSGYSFVSFDRVQGRVYPEGKLASQLIGYLGADGKGLSGIEYSMQDVLMPKVEGSAVKSGKSVYLTIDAPLQYKLEKIAEDALENTHAENMMIVASSAKTGEILSYISLPNCDLNDFTNASIEATIDRPAMSAFEPGSAFKIFTVALLFDAGAIRENDKFVCNGVYSRVMRSGEQIRINCLSTHGALTARDALKYSCNTALCLMSERMSDADFITGIRKLGFGERTGIELPGEANGILADVSSKSWSARSKPTIAIGQEISVTALQMVKAATAIANGGVEIRPTVIKKIVDKDGNVDFEGKISGERVLKKSTASYVLSCMESTAKGGTGFRANLRDISIGVKTGTAQMADSESGGYSETDYVSNCIAIFPVEEPEIVLYIVIAKAKGETYAGRIVAPVIRDAADVIIDHLGLSRGEALSFEHSGTIHVKKPKILRLSNVVPDFSGMSKRELLPLFENSKIKVKMSGNGWVTSQTPAAGTPLTEGMQIELVLE